MWALVAGVQTCALPIEAGLPQAVVEAFGKAARPAMIVGGGVLAKDGAHGDTLALVETLGLIREGWNGYNVLHFAAARMGGLMLGYATDGGVKRSEEHTSELQSLMRISYAVFCLK